ncbi:MAG: hypothetical protein DME26_02240 [Verrucomicrobia bacterium]|nr:MAG: hypothetical protein DME26_02240 [Verrucomicrobiota bacterium]
MLLHKFGLPGGRRRMATGQLVSSAAPPPVANCTATLFIQPVLRPKLQVGCGGIDFKRARPSLES